MRAAQVIEGERETLLLESPAAFGAEATSGPSAPIRDYGDAVWWTAYAMTTGATSQPVTGEGKLLGWLLSLYGLAVFGYLTATLASHFIGRERQSPGTEGKEAREL